MEILLLGEKIKRKRKEMNMTLKDLAGDRITPGQISLVESGRSNPSMDLLEYLAGTLNTSVEYLMESEETQAEKICIYYEQIAESYILNGDYIAGEKYIEMSLYYAEKYNLEYRKAKNMFLRAKIHMGKNELILAQQFYLSANVIFIKNNNYEQIINSFLNLGKITLELKAFHSATTYLKQAEKVYIDNNVGNDRLLGEIYYQMAEAFYKTDNLEKAMNYSFFAKEKFEQLGDKKKYAKTLLLLSQEYAKRDDISNAIKYSEKTLKIFNELEEDKHVAEIENNLGKLFYEFDNIEESFKHLEIAKEMRIRNNDDKVIETLLNICENYIKLKDLDKCEEVLNEINKFIECDNIEMMIEEKLLWFRVYTMREKYPEAEITLLNVFKLANLGGLKKKAAEVAIMLGKYYIDFKNDGEAAKYLDEGVSLFKELGILNK